MTLIGAILKKAKSQDTVVRKYRSPPPEMKEQFRSKKKLHKDDHIKAVVDSRPPRYDRQLLARNLPKWRRRALEIAIDNTRLVMGIKMAHFKRGKVDCHWKEQPPTSKIYHENRVRFLKEIQRENKSMYKRIVQANPRVESTATLQRAWQRNREEMLQKAQKPFIIFPPVPRDLVEDVAFCPLSTGKRIRVYLTIGFRGGAVLGELKIELFKDICPATCRLFLELMDGDQFGYGYVGTRFFRKVPGLYWSGGDVVYDNGFGCYAQRGRICPIGAENYHLPHSMPGLLSMRVTRDDEVCGNFNITFKPLPQFDLKNVVFGMIIRPCAVYEAMRGMGDALSTQPVIEIVSARRRVDRQWRFGAKNVKMDVFKSKTIN